MKNIFKFFGAFLTVVLAAALTGCTIEEDLETADVGLHIKVFFPTKVVAGQPMTINGSGFSTAAEIVFPDGVSVTDFEIVSNDMIRVNAPAGISAEGGTITVRTEEGEAVSPLPLTLGNTVITGYSVVEGDVISGGNPITIYGTDLEFITRVEMLDADGNPSFVEDDVFNRKGTSNVIFTVPKKVFDGEFVAKVHTVDGKTFNMPSITYEPVVEGGYWDVVEKVIWENPDPAGIGAVAWSGQYRFGLEGTDGNNECITTFPADVWDIIKNGTFYMTYSAPDAYQIRATTGWWSFDSAGAYDIHGGDERVVDNGDGTFTLAYTLSEEPLKSGIYDLVDQQHLLMTGSGFTPLKFFVTEEVWVPGGEGSIEIVKTPIWTNDGSVAAAAWSGSPYRFAPEFNSTGEEVYAVPADVWEMMKAGPFYVTFKPVADWWQIRILDAWWSVGNNDANDITPNYEGLVDNGDGTYTIVVDLSGNADLLAVLDAQHLLFAGDGFQILEMYFQEEVFVGGGGGAKEFVIWENDGSLGEGTWGNTYRFALEGKNGGDASVDVPADVWEKFKTGPFMLNVKPVADWWQIRVLTGWWSGQWPAADNSGEGDINVNWTDIVADNGDGTFTVTIDLTGHEIIDLLDEQNLLFAGAGFQILKSYCME